MLPPVQRQEDREYMEVEEVFKKLCAVKLDGDRIGTVRLEKAFQETLLSVQEVQRLSPLQVTIHVIFETI